MNNSVDLHELLDIDDLEQLSYQEKMQIFSAKSRNIRVPSTTD